uniref:Uncharacterized protein n=1 Tax=Arundo donax TaxID=35708 RepID=A0A0A8YH03_ARUDO
MVKLRNENKIASRRNISSRLVKVAVVLIILITTTSRLLSWLSK